MKRVLKEEILNLRRLGKSYDDIRKELGCTKSVISYHCKNAGIAKGTNKPSNEEILKFNSLYLSGLTIKEVSNITGYVKSTVSKYLTVPIRVKSTKLSKSQCVIDWRKRKKQELVNYKGGKCIICGYNKCIAALTFHHLDPLDKDFTIGGKSWSFSRLKLEVDKCIIVCSNCHIEIHQGLHNDFIMNYS